MSKNRSEGLLVRAEPLEQAEHISRLIADVRVVDGVLLLDADPAWAGAINTVLVKKGVRVSELCLTAKDEPEATLRCRRSPYGASEGTQEGCAGNPWLALSVVMASRE